jgi:hypothetical protein
MQGFDFCSDMEKMVLRMVAGPVSHGSRRMVKDPGNRPGEDTGAAGGEKVRRKAVSPFSDCTVKGMAARRQRGREAKRGGHEVDQRQEDSIEHDGLGDDEGSALNYDAPPLVEGSRTRTLVPPHLISSHLMSVWGGSKREAGAGEGTDQNNSALVSVQTQYKRSPPPPTLPILRRAIGPGFLAACS